MCKTGALNAEHAIFTKNPQRNRAPLQPIYTGEPFKRIAMDIVGPRPRTSRGIPYILTVVDHFTKDA